MNPRRRRLDPDRAAQGLAERSFPDRLASDPAKFDGAQFTGLRRFLEQRFPRVHATLRRETVNDFSLLYTWEGREPGRSMLLLAHLDVVPIEAGTEGDWTQPPFSGAVADGHIWPRRLTTSSASPFEAAGCSSSAGAAAGTCVRIRP